MVVVPAQHSSYEFLIYRHVCVVTEVVTVMSSPFFLCACDLISNAIFHYFHLALTFVL